MCLYPLNTIWYKNRELHLEGDKSAVDKSAVDELLERGFNENDIFTSPKDMPRIWYVYKGEKHKYYPDIYIKSMNLFIEVKSTWTLNKNLEQNRAKFRAVVDQDIELWCYNNRKEITELWFKTKVQINKDG